MENPHQTQNGLKYLFAYFNTDDKCWRVPNRRFILHQTKTHLTGQFLQSTWFNKLFTGEDLQFMVLPVNNCEKVRDIESELNELKKSWENIPYMKDTGYYSMDQLIITKCLSILDKKTDIEFTLKSITNTHQRLTLKLYKHDDDTLYISNPQFQSSIV